MTRILRRALLVMALVGVAPGPMRADGDPELIGVYVSKGVNPDGTPYQGFVRIARHGENFLVSWIFPRLSNEMFLLEQSAVGVGILEGGMLAVAYLSPDRAGVVVYRVEEGGHRLAGHWAVVGDGAAHAETLTKLPSDAVEFVPVEPAPLEPAPAEPAPTEPPRGDGPARRKPPVSLPPGTVSL